MAASRASLPPFLLLLVRLALLSSLTLAVGACSRAGQDTARTWKSGTQPFGQFDPRQVTMLEITKSDPASGDRWSARIERQPTPLPGGDPHWLIQAGPSGAELPDRIGNGGFIVHLLDTLKTLRVAAEPRKGPLESYGLSQPRWALRWSGPGIAPLELRLGLPSEEPSAAYAEISGSVTTVQGAALQMLDYLKSFSTLRHQTLATFSSDEIDEIEIETRANAGRARYAERNGSSWSGPKGRPLARSWDAAATLEAITHFQIREFLDDPVENSRTAAWVSGRPDVRITLKPRTGEAFRLLIREQGGRAAATISGRPGNAFLLHPGALSRLR